MTFSQRMTYFQRLENVERKSVKEEANDMSSIIEKLKSQRRPSNSSSVSATSITGAIESTSGVNMEHPVTTDPTDPAVVAASDPNAPTNQENAVTEIAVAFASDASGTVSGNASCPEDEEKLAEKMAEIVPEKSFADMTRNVPEMARVVPENSKPNILQTIFGGGPDKAEQKENSADMKPPSLLESIFSSASKKGKGVVSMATESAFESSLTNITPLDLTEHSLLPEDDFERKPESPLDAMSQILQKLKQQSGDKTPRSDNDPTDGRIMLEERPAAPGAKAPKVLIFGDELIADMDKVLTEQFKYAIEIHMIDGAQTKNIQKYISESIGTRKDAEVCIFHVGTNDIAGMRSESQFNTDLMLLFGACRASFPNAKLCCSSILPRHDEFASKVSKFNAQADKQCENCAVEFLNNTTIFSDVDNYTYKLDPTECVQLTREGKGSLGMHMVCYIEDSIPEGEGFVKPEMIIGPKLRTKLPKEGIEVRNLTPVCEDKDDHQDNHHPLAGLIPDGPRPLGDGSKVNKSGRDRDGHGDGSQSPLPPTPTSSSTLPILANSSPIMSQTTTPTVTHQPAIPHGQYNELSNLATLVRRQSDDIEKLRKEIRQSRSQPSHQKSDFAAQKDVNVKFERLSNELKQFQRNMQNQIK